MLKLAVERGHHDALEVLEQLSYTSQKEKKMTSASKPAMDASRDVEVVMKEEVEEEEKKQDHTFFLTVRK